MGKGGGRASSVKMNLTFHCRTVLWLRDARPAGQVTCCSTYMREYNAESPKQGSKRFNSQERRNTLPFWLYNLSTRYMIVKPMKKIRKLLSFSLTLLCLCPCVSNILFIFHTASQRPTRTAAEQGGVILYFLRFSITDTLLLITVIRYIFLVQFKKLSSLAACASSAQT